MLTCTVSRPWSNYTMSRPHSVWPVLRRTCMAGFEVSAEDVQPKRGAPRQVPRVIELAERLDEPAVGLGELL